MSTSVPIPPAAPRLDRWNRYVIGDAPHTRVTTVAKALDDGGALAPWKSTMSIVGLFNRRGLMAQWEALIAETRGDPWYRSPETKRQCKALVEKCAEAGGSADSADVGTSLHALTALVDRGFDTPGLSPGTERDLTAYVNTLAEYGVVVDRGFVEVLVTLDAFRVAGTADRFRVTVPGFDEPLVADIKTGQDLQYSWQSIAIQLAAYANAEHQYIYGAAPEFDQRRGLPAVSKTHALVIHLPSGSGRCSLHVVDIVAGWEAFKTALTVREWRTRKGLAAPLGAYQPVAPIDVSKARHPSNTKPMAAVDYSPVGVELRDWLQKRIDVVGEIPAARVELLTNWPLGVVSLRASNDHTPAQLAEIERVLDAVEAKYSVPFGATRPALNVIHVAFPSSEEMDDE